jgi:xylulokinase
LARGPLIVGVDVGTTNTKAVVYELDGRVVAAASRPTPIHYPRPGWASFHIDELWASFVSALREVTGRLDDPGRIAGISVASFAESGVPLDAAGVEATNEVIAWFDTRTRAEVAWLDQVIGKDQLFARTGLSLQPIFTLSKLLWIKANQPEVWRRTRRWLNMADYFLYRLSGEQATDFSLASRMLTLDLHHLRWDVDLMRQVGIEPELLAPLVDAGTWLGPVLPAVAAEAGLPATAIVASGGHDHVCGSLAAGVLKPGTLLNSLGTAEALFVPLMQPLTDPAAGRQGYTQGVHVVGRHRYLFAGQYTSGASVDWLRGVLGGSERDWPPADMIREAAAAPVGSLGVVFLPHLRMANPPHDDPRSRGAFVGLSTDVGRGTLARAVLEGLAFETRGSYEPLRRFPGVAAVERIVAIGGGAKNELLMQIKANVMAQTHTVLDVDEAVALGAAILGGLGAGLYPDAETAIAGLRYDRRDIAPEASATEVYDVIYRQVYQRLYPGIAPLSHALDEVRTSVTSPASATD